MADETDLFLSDGNNKVNVGGPTARLTDDLQELTGRGRMRTAQDRESWNAQGEAYIQQQIQI